MALKNRLGTGVFNWEGSSIKIRSDLGSLQQLSEATGKDPILFLQMATTQLEMAELFYHLQHDSEYSRDEIYAAFFCRIDDFQNGDFQMKIAKCLGDAIGTDLIEQLAPEDDTQKK